MHILRSLRTAVVPGHMPGRRPAEHADADGGAPASTRHQAGDPAPWQVLLVAVTARLRRIRASARGDNRLACGRLLECASALDRLQAAQRDVLLRNDRLARELAHTRRALVLAHAALADLGDGDRQARHEAQHDALTTLPNRRHFSARLQQALAAPPGERGLVAVLYIDLDRFKPVNDQHGHAAGDEVLRIVAARLMRTVREGDLVARLGGDEFACLLDDLPDASVLDGLARKMIEVIAAPIALGATGSPNQAAVLEVSVRPSIGLAVCDAGSDTPARLLQCADAAMYRAKRLQAGHARFDPALDVVDRAGPPGD